MPSALESSIDKLYQGPLPEFVSARTALARALSGADAARVKRLPKPSIVPWAANQLYWHARASYDRLAASGEKLRKAQIANLKGQAADVRRAADEHRRAIAGAVAEASRQAKAAGLQPNAEELARTFEALSVASKPVEQPGRLTKPLHPAGFEALAGIAVKQSVHQRAAPPRGTLRTPPAGRSVQWHTKAEADGLQREQAAARARNVAARKAIKHAETAAARARALEARARTRWERSKENLARAERAVADLRETVRDSHADRT